MSKISNDKLKELMAYYVMHGRQKTLDTYGIKDDSLRRYLDEAKLRGLPEMDKSRVLGQIAEQYTDKELQAIAKGGRIVPGIAKVPLISFEGERIRIGGITDTHIGHERFDEGRLFQAFEEFKKEGVEFIVHCGDVTEGMSNRAGHIYELNKLGYDNQKKYAIDLFSQWTDTDIYAIDGNHDRWFLKSNGAIVVKDIAESIDNFHWLGHDEGDISLKGLATLKLWHGEDGNSYALSYRLQKILESLSGGEKPHAMLCGHTHKHVYIFERNVHCTSIGSLQAQTKWMRGKRIAAHVGFFIADYWVNKSGICKVTQTWYPFYT
jgi:predicted phosphodiesterase